MTDLKDRKTKNLLIKLAAEYHTQLKIMSFKRYTTMQDLLNTIITEYLDKHKEEYENELR